MGIFTRTVANMTSGKGGGSAAGTHHNVSYLISKVLLSMAILGRCGWCLVFFINQFPPQPQPIRTVSNFFENSRRYSQLKVDHRCQRHRWQMRKIFNQKTFNNFVGTPLDSRVNTYIHCCLQVHFKISAA